MQSDQLYTAILLVVLGLLIYMLNKPCAESEYFDNEKFEDATMAPTQPSFDATQPPVIPAQPSFAATQPPVRPAQPSVDVPTPSSLTDFESQGLVMNAGPTKGPVPTPETPVFRFGDNDMDLTGAELATAFEKPLPQGVNPDKVDLNKNNVKNYNTKDFLPKEINNDWFDTDFSQAKMNLNDDKLINTERYVIGVNTVGQSLKNASYDIRGTIANPKFAVSPWNNSTIEPDNNLKSLC